MVKESCTMVKMRLVRVEQFVLMIMIDAIGLKSTYHLTFS